MTHPNQFTKLAPKIWGVKIYSETPPAVDSEQTITTRRGKEKIVKILKVNKSGTCIRTNDLVHICSIHTDTRSKVENALDRRKDWQHKRDEKSFEAFDESRQIGEDCFPGGSPIIVGHHSEKKARRMQAKMWRKADESLEHAKMAEHHGSVAESIEHKLEKEVFLDDDNAADRLRAEIAELQKELEESKASNKRNKKIIKESNFDDDTLYALYNGYDNRLSNNLKPLCIVPSYHLTSIRNKIKTRERNLRNVEKFLT